MFDNQPPLMVRVLAFNNMHAWMSKESSQQDELSWKYAGPGKLLRANPYAKNKHIGFADSLKRLSSGALLAMRSLRYDVLVVDRTITGLITAFFLWPLRRPKILIESFNVPRRRTLLWLRITRPIIRRIDHFIVHSRYDIGLATRLYGLGADKFTFIPYTREIHNLEEIASIPLGHFEETEPFILSFGGNGRDYATLLRAVEGTSIRLVVVARDYNLKGLQIPPNVQVHCNIPMAVCDSLVKASRFTVFTFDGSEPSCGQISVVTSFLFGKPIICTDWIGIHDYVTPGENGLYARLGDVEDLREKLIELTANYELRSRLSQGAFRWAAEHTVAASQRRRMEGIVKKLVIT